MQPFTLSLFLLALVWCAQTGHAQSPNDVGSAENKEATHKEDVIYGRKADLALTMDVFTPAKPNGAAIVHLANGGWHRAHDDPSTFAEWLKRGYTVFRVVAAGEPKFTIPEQMVDVDRAVRFIRLHAKEYDIDPNRLGITGASSGGHLALLQANAGNDGNPQSADPLERTSSRVQAAACFFPLTDFLNYGGPGIVQCGDLGPLAYHHPSFDFQEFDAKARTYVKVTDDAKRREILRHISPISHVTKDSPPTFIMHGDRDAVVPLQQSEEMVAALKAVGVPVKLVVKKDGGHPWPDFWRADSPALADWFDVYLKPRNP
jgi:acetyl esterase/lipase